MKANWICLEGAGCGTTEVNNTAQLRDTCKAASELPLPQSLSNPTYLPRVSTKRSLDFCALDNTKEVSFLNLQLGLLLLQEALLCPLLSYLLCFIHDSGRQEVFEGLGNHPQLYTLITTGKCAATSFHIENQCFFIEQMLRYHSYIT